MLGMQSKAILPRIFLLTGTVLTAFNFKPSFKTILRILFSIFSSSSKKNNCPTANLSERSMPCSLESVLIKNSLLSWSSKPHPSPVLPSEPIPPL